jgi:hypothetical protein
MAGPGPALEDIILDSGLTVLDQNTTFISVCSTEPQTIAIAATSGLLGYKSFAAGGAFGAPAAGTSPVGRQVTSTQISDGTITTTGTASWWAAYVAGTLHAHGTLSGAQAVTLGNTFTLAPFTIKIPNQ